MKSCVTGYVRDRGNSDASEILDDYMEPWINYLQSLGYAIRRKKYSKAQTDHVTAIQKPITIHLVR